MRVDQVALNMREGLHFDAAHLLLAGPWSHGWVLSTIDELADNKDGHSAQVLREAEGGEDNGDSGHQGPLKLVAHRADHDHHGNGK